MNTLRAVLGAAATLLLAACLSIGNSGPSAPHAHHALHDPAPLPARRAEPIVPALLIRALPADALADTVSIAYSPRPDEYAFYQLASWTERPLRRLPRLLQRRLEASGIAAAVGQDGDPLRADWLLTLRIETLHHDVAVPPGAGRLVLTAELFDRRKRQRVAQRRRRRCRSRWPPSSMRCSRGSKPSCRRRWRRGDEGGTCRRAPREE